jgi:hypothetical protein
MKLFSTACKLPKDAGNCRAAIPNWYFDVASKKCKSFIYGGCYGNANNFGTQEECERECIKNKTAVANNPTYTTVTTPDSHGTLLKINKIKYYFTLTIK